MIEISLAMAFISILSITIVLLISNTVTTYHRGMVLNQINTVGMAIVDDMRASIQAAPSESLISNCAAIYTGANSATEARCESDGGLSFMTAKRNATVRYTNGQQIGNVPIYGVYCTGKYSYIWNSGYLFNNNDYEVSGVSGGIRVTYKVANDTGTTTGTTSPTARLVKIADEDRMVCKRATGYNGTDSGGSYTVSTSTNSLPNLIDISGKSIEETPENILEENGSMSLYDLMPSVPAMNGFSNSSYTSVSFILGTIQGGINITAQSDYCKVPEDYTSGIADFNYCAINKFNFAARSMGE